MIDVIWEDDTAMVVNKPSGLLTTAARGVESLETRLQQFFESRGDRGAANSTSVYFGLPHRIDRPVSGAVLVGKTRRATKQFCAQFQARMIDKEYVAVVAGHVDSPQGRWEDWMRKIPERAEAEMVAADSPDAKHAVLEYRSLGTLGSLTCLAIRLHTGRTHQIRLQAATRGLSILGDHLYGSEVDFGPQCDDPRQRAIALHARRIGFRHARTGKTTTVIAPVPDTWHTLALGDDIMQHLG